MAATPDMETAFRQLVAQMKQALQAHLTGGVYLNFLEGEEAVARSRDGFSPEAYRRLQALKAIYDPENRFSHSYDLTNADAAHHLPN
jgi:FAD/FMN-containing dehydrogenase